jgi:hypothetical protein
VQEKGSSYPFSEKYALEPKKVGCVSSEIGLIFSIFSLEEFYNGAGSSVKSNYRPCSYFCTFCTYSFANNKTFHGELG